MMKLRVRYPAVEELNAIIDRTTQSRSVTVHRVMTGPAALSYRELVREVPIASHVRDFVSAVVMATHPQWEHAPETARRYVRYGASPRGAQAMVLSGKVRALAAGRYNVSVEDLKAVAAPALRHRIILNFEGEAEGIDVDNLIGQIIESAEVSTVSRKETFLR
jgi:MoxR-like ATPase